MTTAMNLLQGEMVHAITQALGWTLVHFLWQGVLVALVLWCVLALMARRSAGPRYVAACVALLAMVALPALTFARLAERAYQAAQAGGPVADCGGVVIDVGAGGSGPSLWAAVTARMDVIMPWLMLAWCAGVAVFSCRLAMGMTIARRLKLRETETVSERLRRSFNTLSARMGISRAVKLVHSARVHVPTVIGWLRPVVLLPAACLAGLSELQIEALLAHELAHVRRNDYLVSLMQSLVETLLFYHPAVWWVSKQVRREREYCCDELAVSVCGDRVAYARALSLLEERRALMPEMVLGANGGVLIMRIKRLLGYKEEIVTTNMVWALVLAVVIAGAGSIVGRIAYAEAKRMPSAEPRPIDQPNLELQAAAADAAKQAAEINEQVRSANQESARAQEQLSEIQRDLAEPTKDAAHWSAADQKQLDEAMKKVQAALQQVNSDDFKKEMEQLQQRLNSPEFRKQIQDATAAAMKNNSAEMKKQMEAVRKQLADSRELQEQIRAKMNSPEFKKQMEDAMAQAKAAAAKMNSPEFRAQMEAMRKKAAEFDTPESREKMKQLSEDARKKADEFEFDTPEFREKMKQLADQARVNSDEMRAKADEARNEARANKNEMMAANGAPATGPEAKPNPAPAPNGPIRVSPSVTSGQVVKQVPPVYPADVKAAGIQGTVTLKAIIGKDGTVEKLSVLSGPKELLKSAIDAVSQWQYKPYLLNGQPVEVETTINVNYTLSDAASPNPGPQSSLEPFPRAPAVPMVLNAPAIPALPSRPAVPATLRPPAMPAHPNVAAVEAPPNVPAPPLNPSVPPVPAIPTRTQTEPASGVRMPTVIYKVSPEYTAEAKAAKVQGTVALNLVVNQQGFPVNVRVMRALGMGLDENAVAAVKQYRFQPAIKDGVAIEKPVNIVVDYKLN